MTVLVIVLYSDFFVLDFFVTYTWLPALENWIIESICKLEWIFVWYHLMPSYIVLSGILKVFKHV